MAATSLHPAPCKGAVLWMPHPWGKCLLSSPAAGLCSPSSTSEWAVSGVQGEIGQRDGAFPAFTLGTAGSGLFFQTQSAVGTRLILQAGDCPLIIRVGPIFSVTVSVFMRVGRLYWSYQADATSNQKLALLYGVLRAPAESSGRLSVKQRQVLNS